MDAPPPGPPPLRRQLLAAGLIALTAALALAMYRPRLVTSADAHLYDALTRRAATGRASDRVVIVDVDERSLAAVGQWPWPRDVIARLVSGVRALGATTTALDMVFAEPDRGGERPARGTSEPPDAQPTDAALAETLREGGVVLGYAMTFDGDGTAPDRCVLHPLGLAVVEAGGERSGLYQASGAVCSLPLLADAAGASGFLNAAPDPDGILRRVPLAIGLAGRLYPSLALASVAEALDAHPSQLRVADANTAWLTLGERRVPLDRYGNLLVRYLGRKGTFTYVSALDVLSNRAGPATFAGRLAFVGATALGTQEDVATPMEARFTGVEVQATVAQNLLDGEFIRRPGYAPFAEALLVLLAFPVAAAVLLAGVARGTVLAAALCGVMGWASVSSFAAGLYVSPLLGTAGVALSWVAAVITRLRGERARAAEGERQARRQALVAAAAKHELLRKVSHELRTPLTAIAGWAQLLGSGGLSDEQKRLAVSTIRRNVKAQTTLIENLVDTSELEKEDIQLDLRPVDLRELVSSAAADYASALAARGIHLDVEMDAGPCVVSADPRRLPQMIAPLLSNAAKFTPEGGTVRVRVAPAGEFVELAVGDTGIGIAREFLPHVFERFRQQDDLTTRPQGGLGLGLVIVQQLVHMHGGSVRAESPGENQGATFTVRLPRVPASTGPT